MLDPDSDPGREMNAFSEPDPKRCMFEVGTYILRINLQYSMNVHIYICTYLLEVSRMQNIIVVLFIT